MDRTTSATRKRWTAVPSLLAGSAAFLLGLTYVGAGCDLEFSVSGWLLVVVLGGSLGLGVVASTALMTIVTVVVAGLALTWASDIMPLGRWDRDLLGPASEHQRIEVSEEGFAISFPELWSLDTDPSADSDFTLRTGLRAALTAALPDGESSCTVYARSDVHPSSEGCFPGAADESWGVASWDVADDVIAPLMSEYDCPSGFGIGALRQGGPVSLSFEGRSGSVLVAYHLRSGDRDFVLTCDVALPWPDGDGADDAWPRDAMGMQWAIQPIAETFELLPEER